MPMNYLSAKVQKVIHSVIVANVRPAILSLHLRVELVAKYSSVRAAAAAATNASKQARCIAKDCVIYFKWQEEDR